MDDWLLFLHILSAFALVGAVTTFWALLFAPAGPLVGRLAGPATAVVTIGSLGTIVFGVWLAIYLDQYQVWDGWILASIVLWFVATGTGARAGAMPFSDDAAERRRGLVLQIVSTIATLTVLVLMIYKPGA